MHFDEKPCLMPSCFVDNYVKKSTIGMDMSRSTALLSSYTSQLTLMS